MRRLGAVVVVWALAASACQPDPCAEVVCTEGRRCVPVWQNPVTFLCTADAGTP